MNNDSYIYYRMYSMLIKFVCINTNFVVIMTYLSLSISAIDTRKEAVCAAHTCILLMARLHTLQRMDDQVKHSRAIGKLIPPTTFSFISGKALAMRCVSPLFISMMCGGNVS